MNPPGTGWRGQRTAGRVLRQDRWRVTHMRRSTYGRSSSIAPCPPPPSAFAATPTLPSPTGFVAISSEYQYARDDLAQTEEEDSPFRWLRFEFIAAHPRPESMKSLLASRGSSVKAPPSGRRGFFFVLCVCVCVCVCCLLLESRVGVGLIHLAPAAETSGTRGTNTVVRNQ